MARLLTINPSDGAAAQIAGVTDGDILEIQNVSDTIIELDNEPVDKLDASKRGFFLYPGAPRILTGTLSRLAVYLTHSGSGPKAVIWKRYTAAS